MSKYCETNIKNCNNFTFHCLLNVFKNNTNYNPSTQRGHNIVDIGNSLITLGGYEKKQDRNTLRMYSIPKDNISKFKKYTITDRNEKNNPKYRFGHSTCYIPPLNAILFFGGFDHNATYSDSK